MSARARCALACALLWVAASAAADVLVYRGRHRPVEELLPIARALLGDEGRAEVDARTNSLVLVGDAEALVEVENVLSAQDRAPRTVVLRYGSQRLTDLEAAGVRVRWRVEGDGYRIGNARLPGDGTRVVVGVDAERQRGDAALHGSLRVLEGGAGRIHTGSSFPVALRTRRGPAAAWVSAESGFEARPRILGDGRVQLELLPFDAAPTGSGIAHAGAATTLVVAPGERVVIGGLATRQAGTEAGAAGAAAGHSADERVLVIRVEVEIE